MCFPPFSSEKLIRITEQPTFFTIVKRCVDEESQNQNATQEIMLVYYIKQSETKWLAPVKDVKDAL